MTAYVVLVRQETKHPEHFAKYYELAPLAPADGVQFVAKNSEFEIVEGRPAEAVVILSFPSMKHARAWYKSDEYQKAVAHRLAAADYMTLLVDGAVNVPEDYPGYKR
jgi:uncharacterized protein (DUF1330 family)